MLAYTGGWPVERVMRPTSLNQISESTAREREREKGEEMSEINMNI